MSELPLTINPDALRRITPDRIMLSLNLPMGAPDGEYDFNIVGVRLTIAGGTQAVVLIGEGTHANPVGSNAKRHLTAQASARGVVPGSAIPNTLTYAAPVPAPVTPAPAPTPAPFGLAPAAPAAPATAPAVAAVFAAQPTAPEADVPVPPGALKTVYNIKLHPLAVEGAAKDALPTFAPGPDNVEEIMVVAASPREARQIAAAHVATLPGGSVDTSARWVGNKTDLYALGAAAATEARTVVRVTFVDNPPAA